MITRTALKSGLAFAVVTLLLLLASAAHAQLAPATASVTRLTGRVEVQRRGAGPWIPATTGLQLSQGDHVRALSGASAELALPDGSTVVVAENTRIAVTKVDYDPQARARNVSLHLAAGKVRARVAQTAVQLVRARGANFTISSPTGVAAVRGTIVVFAYNPDTQQGLLLVQPSPGEPPSAAQVTYFNFATSTVVNLTGNQYITLVRGQLPSTPAPISALPPNVLQEIQGASFPGTAGSPELTSPTVFLVSAEQIESILTRIGVQLVVGPPPTPRPPVAPPPGTPGTPSGRGRDLSVLPPSGPPPGLACASPPCP
jgi:hypothetical protein